MIQKVSDSYRKNLPALVFGPMLKMVEAAFDLLIPLFMKAIIDLSEFGTPEKITNPLSRGIAFFIESWGTWIPNDEPLNAAIVGGTMILLMGLLGFGVTMITQYVAAKTAVKVGTEVRDALYQRILSLSQKEREGQGTSRLLTILNADTYQVQQGVLIFIRLIVRAPFIILGALAISFVLNWEIGFVFLAIIPLILLVIFLVMRRSSKEYLGIQNELDVLSTKASDDLDGAKVIRAFRSEDYENENFRKASEDYRKKSIHVDKVNALINPLTFAIISLATIGVVLFGGLPILKETSAEDVLLSSTIITEVAYLMQIFTTLVQLTNVVLVLTRARVSRKRCDEVLALKPAIVDDPKGDTRSIKHGEPMLSFTDVALAYKEGGNKAVEGISFTLRKGESLGLIGGTGSGKSTLVNLMERFLDRTEGKIEYKGEDIRNYRLSALRKEIGYVPQKSVLFKGTIRSNLLLANPEATDEDLVQALKEAMAWEFVSKYEKPLDEPVEEGGKNFSGGQRQRLCIARALVKKPETAILDDATSALDLLTDKTVRENLKRDFPGMTKIFVSQRVSTVQDCTHILVLDGGKPIGYGTHEELLASCPVYKDIYETQTRKEGE